MTLGLPLLLALALAVAAGVHSSVHRSLLRSLTLTLAPPLLLQVHYPSDAVAGAFMGLVYVGNTPIYPV